jgi:hypothetical protein
MVVHAGTAPVGIRARVDQRAEPQHGHQPAACL